MSFMDGWIDALLRVPKRRLESCVTMETLATAVIILGICAGPCQTVSACGGQIDHVSGYIQSPNFGAEYGKVANCLWRFDYINMNYTLRLMLTYMRMYYYDVNSDKQCSDAYRLIINGEPIDCMMEMGAGMRAPKFYAFYSNTSCTELQCDRKCENLIKIDSTSINVQYIADGSKPNANANAREMLGFKIKYEYVKCPGGSATNAPVTMPTQVTTSTSRQESTPPLTRPTTEQTTQSKMTIPESSRAIPPTSQSAATPTEAPDSPASTISETTQSQKPVESDDGETNNDSSHTQTFLGSFTGTLPVTVLVVIAIIVRYSINRRANVPAGQDVTSSKNAVIQSATNIEAISERVEHQRIDPGSGYETPLNLQERHDYVDIAFDTSRV